jgi:hypothetical protein
MRLTIRKAFYLIIVHPFQDSKIPPGCPGQWLFFFHNVKATTYGWSL